MHWPPAPAPANRRLEHEPFDHLIAITHGTRKHSFRTLPLIRACQISLNAPLQQVEKHSVRPWQVNHVLLNMGERFELALNYCPDVWTNRQTESDFGNLCEYLSDRDEASGDF